MKKIVLSLFSLFFCLVVNAQDADLYDVNFDTPGNIPSYDENVQVFQDIYLQYEDLIHKTEERIRSEEKNIRQNNAQKFQENLKLAQEQAQQEQKKHQEELNQALAKQKQEIYTNEIEQLRKDEYEKLSTELHDSITEDLTEKFAVEYENKVKQLSDEYNAEYVKKLKEETEKLAQEYDAKIAEVERQKESEMKAWKKENKKQALEETNARTERIRILSKYIVVVIAIAVIILIIWLLSKVIIKYKQEKNNKKKELETRNRQIKNYKDEYLNRLERVGSSNVYRDEIKNIYSEINESQESEDVKELRREAVGQAANEFDSSRITRSIDEYRKIFDNLNPKRYFDTWNGLKNDIEAKNGIISEIRASAADYEKYAISACNSKNDQTDIANMLKPYVPILENNSDQLKTMKDSESDKSLKKDLSDLSEKYQELADKFNKGRF